MHDDHARRPLPGRLLIFVGPAAVIGHGPAVEGVQLGLFEIGVIDQHDDDLAAHIDVLEVVPVPLRRIDAVADEDQRGVAQHHMTARQTGRDGDLLALGQRDRLAAGAQLQATEIGDTEAVEHHVLGPGPVGPARLEARSGILFAQIADGHVLRRGGDAPALEAIIRQHPGMFGQARGIKGRGARDRGGIPPRAHRGAAGNQGAGGKHGGGREQTHERNTLSRNQKSGR